MKRGIPIALQAAGAVLACLVTTLNHPVMAFEQAVSMRDTAYYYNESGVQIYCNTKAVKREYFVIRTCKTHRELFPDWYERDTTISTGNYHPARVRNITRAEADTVEWLIHNGQVDNPRVKRNVVPILNKEILKKIQFKIIYSTDHDTSGKFKEYGGDGLFREYGGRILTNSTFTFTAGRTTDPRQSHNNGVDPGVGPLGNFHSHPAGEIQVPIDDKHVRVHNFVQAPSRQDEHAIGDKTGYVFAMRTQKIYVFDRFGIKACIPIDFCRITTPCD